MSKKVKLYLAQIALVAAYLCGGERAIALETAATAFPVGETESNSERLIIASREEEEELAVLEQVTSVSQLSDIQPTDWAFQALQSLVERYGCIAGYPDGTYRGNRAMTRFEFAAGLNACLDRITELIASSTADLVTREDLALLQRLQEEFAAELATLRGRVDVLEARTLELENNQFSTTTKLFGVAVFEGIAFFDGAKNNQPVFQHEVFLNTLTSFTGRDLLSIAMLGNNTLLPTYDATNNGINVGSTREGVTGTVYGGFTDETFFLVGLEYIFPVIYNENNQLYVTITPFNGFNTSRFLLPLSNITWEGYAFGNGPVSAFGQRSPLYRLGGGGGALVNYNAGPWRITGFYLAEQSSNPAEGGGLFNGGNIAGAQVNYTSGNIALALAYQHNYFTPGRFAFNSQYKIGANSPGFVGTALANRFDNAGVFFNEDVAVSSHSYGVQAFYQISPKAIIGGFVTKIDASLIGRGEADIWTYALSLSFPDLGKEGNLGGAIVGVEPTLTGLKIDDEFVGGFKRDTSFHIEAYYQFQVNDNIAITPGVIWITAPNQDADNDDMVVGVLRTTFSF